jgi:hypothetical protein
MVVFVSELVTLTCTKPHNETSKNVTTGFIIPVCSAFLLNTSIHGQRIMAEQNQRIHNEVFIKLFNYKFKTDIPIFSFVLLSSTTRFMLTAAETRNE